MVTAEQISNNVARFFTLLGKDKVRGGRLIAMYKRRWPHQIVEAPASGKTHYHNCFPGGYVDHVLRVYDQAILLAKQYSESGGELTFTPDELRFAALHHDMGKLGASDLEPYYETEESDWHRKKLGRMYKHNERIQVMRPEHRALSIFAEECIPVSQNEWLAIMLSDGMYDEGNAYYYKNNMYPNPMKTNLPFLIHTADNLSTHLERDMDSWS